MVTAFVVLISLFFKFSLCGESTHGKFLVSVEACMREGRVKRLLTFGEPDNGKTAKISFTGKRDEPGTKFIYENIWTSVRGEKTMEVVLRPSAFPHCILGVNGGNLIIKNATDVNILNDDAFKFVKKRVKLQYIQDSSVVTKDYDIFMTRSRPRSVIKSNKSGIVFLDKAKNWKDCAAWFIVQNLSNS